MTATPPSETKPAAPALIVPAPRGRWRRVLPWVGGVVVVVGLVYFVLTQTAVSRWIVLSRVGAMIGAEVTAESLKIDPDGLILVQGLVGRAKDVPGEGGVAFRVRSLEARVSVPALLLGRIVLRSLTLEEPLARLSQSVDDGRLNIQGMRVPDFGRAERREPPKVVVRRGALEIGEHTRGSFVSLKRVDVAGEVARSERAGEYTIRFQQVEPGLGGDAILVEGKYGPEGLSLGLGTLPLGKLPPEAVPTPLRDAYRALALEGRIKGVTLEYKSDGQVEATMALDEVALNLPVETRPSEDREGNPVPLPPEQVGRQLRLQRTNGTIALKAADGQGHLEADLHGFVEELPYDVKLRTTGASATSPFVLELSCREFEITKNPQILRFATATAQRRMEQFSHPTGIVDATVTIERGEAIKRTDGTPAAGEIKVSGVLKIRDGTAAFERFPYRFEQMTGEWRFDENRIDIVRVEAVAPSGAKVKANGWIAPLTDDAGAEINVHVEDLPIDAALEEGMGKRRRILDALFSRERYAELLKSGRVVSPAAAARAKTDLAALEARGKGDSPEADAARRVLARPEFEPGGVAKVDVRVWRVAGVLGDEAWNDSVQIHLASARILPEKFPYPILAHDVLISKENDDATIRGGSYSGLRGGSASVTANANLKHVDDPNRPFVPSIRVQGRGLPVDDLFIHAIPERSAGMDGASPVQMLDDLRLSAIVDCDVTLDPTSDGDVTYDVRVTARDASSQPLGPGGAPRVRASKMMGTVMVSQDGLHVDLAGEIGPSNTLLETLSPADRAAAPKPAPFSVKSGVRFQDGASPMWAEVEAKGLDTTLWSEDLVGVVSPEGRSRLVALRADLQPVGVVDVAVSVRKPGREDLELESEFTNPTVAFSNAGTRIHVSEGQGSTRFIAGRGEAPGRFEFTGFAAKMRGGDTPPGMVHLDGAILVGGSPPSPDSRLVVKLRDGRFESPLVARMVRAALGDATANKYDSASPEGEFEMDLSLSGSASEAGRWQSEGELRPRSLALTSNAVRVQFPRVEGLIRILKGGGSFQDLSLHAPTWSATAQGGWHDIGDGSLMADTKLSMKCTGLPPDLRAILPETLMQILREIKFDAKGDVELRHSDFSAEVSRPSSAGAGVKSGARLLRAQGQLVVHDASMDVGVEVKDCDATVDFGYSRAGAEASGELDLWVSAPRFTSLDVGMTNGKARLQQRTDGEIIVPTISADVHGGRLGATATMHELPKGAPPGSAREYECHIRLSDVRFASLLEDLKADTPAMPGTRPVVDSGAGGARTLDESRGRLDAEISLGGRSGDPSTRRGRGSVRIGGERVINVPLVVPLIKLSNLQFPNDERMDFARADFFVAASRVSFEEIVIASKSVGLYGYGTSELNGTNLDLRFRTKTYMEIPLLSTAIESIRNELVTAEVRGSLQKPEINMLTLPGTNRLLSRVVGQTPSEQDVRLDQIQERAERGRGLLPTKRPDEPGRVAPK